MLAHCRQQADNDGLTVRLYEQPFHELDLPVAYQTIYSCGSFGLGGQRSHDAEALRRCRQHLALGGVLVFNHYLPYEDVDRWPIWAPEGRKGLPQSWPETGRRATARNGDELELRARLVDLDPIAQRATVQIRVTLWRDGVVVEEEEHQLQESMYFFNEVLMMLEAAGSTTSPPSPATRAVRQPPTTPWWYSSPARDYRPIAQQPERCLLRSPPT